VDAGQLEDVVLPARSRIVFIRAVNMNIDKVRFASD
jgi:hypothetical protein